ncbi:shikimate O-hydroxycinnamoyltransferase-like isoform X1 [Hibiscus syriacus]|uniref:shikimate O-hydroxycinnamoyltransferase-like isoform X1 n=1 Tax=Hibiscus syriacus TaxID=106335 RepID=UPI001922F1C6|nr:shikimate O-hydroxycinnamoyltransferase-like isoform X1 [Hibiscus syriacus]XP_039067395.1 shikimate O-hydroxycinnamoyltransferase-like isoform X1 [Hibiscus syriacus]
MEITIKESTIVRPAEETPQKTLWNSNLDVVMTRYHLPTVYYYTNPNGSSGFFDTLKLKEALSKVLVAFYPIAGRLGFDENGRLEILCNGEGVLFVEAEASSIMEHLVGDFSDDSQVLQLIPKVDYSGGISSYPLAVLQVTKFKCGGVCLGVGWQHTLGDGLSALHFINSWADIAKGSSPTIGPVIDRTLLGARDLPTPKFHHVEYDPFPLMNSTSDDIKPSTVSTFKLTADQLNTLKDKANAANAHGGIKHSSFNILAAHIWRCVSKARGLSNDQATKLSFPIDGRSKLDPPLPEGYFGNVIFMAAQIARAGDLRTEPFIDTVKRINERLKVINDEYLRSSLDYLEKVSDLSALVRGHHTCRCPNLNIVSWIYLPLYDADFGWGRPLYMGPANVVHEGKFYIIPSPDNDGTMSLVTRLETSHMKLFEQLLYEF